MEKNYDFQKRLLTVHKRGRRMEKPLGKRQIEITEKWIIRYPKDNDLLTWL